MPSSTFSTKLQGQRRASWTLVLGAAPRGLVQGTHKGGADSPPEHRVSPHLDFFSVWQNKSRPWDKPRFQVVLHREVTRRVFWLLWAGVPKAAGVSIRSVNAIETTQKLSIKALSASKHALPNTTSSFHFCSLDAVLHFQ